MELIYGNQPRGSSRLARFADWYYLNSPMAITARKRLRAVVAWLRARAEQMLEKKDQVKILSLACGGASDVVLAFSEESFTGKLEFLGVDHDEAALAHARAKANVVGLSHFRFLKGNALRLQIENKCPFDLVLCLGLFDYFNDKIAAKVANDLHGLLSPGGLFLFGMTGENPSQKAFESRLRWHLKYRSVEQIVTFPKKTSFARSQLLTNCNGCFLLVECEK